MKNLKDIENNINKIIVTELTQIKSNVKKCFKGVKDLRITDLFNNQFIAYKDIDNSYIFVINVLKVDNGYTLKVVEVLPPDEE